MIRFTDNTMKFLTPEGRKLKLLAGALGILQALAWVIMSIICITISENYDLGSPGLFVSNYMEAVQAYMYIYLFGDTYDIVFFDNIISQYTITFFSTVYLIISVVWMMVSINVTFRREGSLKFWSLCTFIVCLWDFIMVVILGRDYDTCMSYKTFDQVGFQSVCVNGVLPILIIAARGFVLWIINFSLAIILMRIAFRVPLGNQQFMASPAQVNFYGQYPSSNFQNQPQPANPQHYQHPTTFPVDANQPQPQYYQQPNIFPVGANQPQPQPQYYQQPKTFPVGANQSNTNRSPYSANSQSPVNQTPPSTPNRENWNNRFAGPSNRQNWRS